jgi:hypothetical protein
LSNACIAATFVLAASAAQGETTFVETFENGSNVDDWYFISNSRSHESIDETGGNPGAFFHNPYTDYILPVAVPGASHSLFRSNYRANRVTAVGIDLITFATEGSTDGRPLSVILRSYNGTPDYI